MPTKRGGWQEYKGQAPPTQTNAEKTQKPAKKQQEEENKTADVKSQNFEYKEYKTLNSLRLVTLSNEGVNLYQLNPNSMDVMETLLKEEGMHHYPGAEIAKFSPIDGRHLAVVDFAGVHIVDVVSKQELRIIEKKGIIAMEWSPKGSYVITCTKFKEGGNNLEVWSAETGNKIFECEWKISAKEGPKSIKFDENEKFCARQIGKNIIEVYENGNFAEPKLQIKSKLPPMPKLNGEV
jgi:WD40 repeat protein